MRVADERRAGHLLADLLGAHRFTVMVRDMGYRMLRGFDDCHSSGRDLLSINLLKRARHRDGVYSGLAKKGD